tara:strand:+ start:789 stop:1067 length:279 start_codon:yes stop_codon:yes gene_type:complete
MVDIDNVARAWGNQAIKDGKFAALLKTRYRALMTQSISDGGLDKVTSATKNGVSMGKMVGLTVPQVIEAMSKAIAYAELGYVIQTSRTLGRF